MSFCFVVFVSHFPKPPSVYTKKCLKNSKIVLQYMINPSYYPPRKNPISPSPIPHPQNPSPRIPPHFLHPSIYTYVRKY